MFVHPHDAVCVYGMNIYPSGIHRKRKNTQQEYYLNCVTDDTRARMVTVGLVS